MQWEIYNDLKRISFYIINNNYFFILCGRDKAKINTQSSKEKKIEY